MNIGIVCAMEREIAEIREGFGETIEYTFGGVEVTEVKMHGHRVLLTISGIGKVSAAMATEALITRFGVDLILNTGLAGGADKRLCAGDAVLVKKAAYHDFTIDSAAFDGLSTVFETDAARTELAAKALKSTDISFIEGIVATGDIFVEDSEHKADIVARTGCSCIDMEAAAIAHVAARNHLPVVIVKVISDSADEHAAADFAFSLDRYAKNCAAFVAEMIAQL